MGLTDIGKWAWKNKGDIASIGGAVYGARKANQSEHKADALQERYIQQMETEYNDRAPLRQQGTAGLMNAEQPYNMGNVGYDPTNPFSRTPLAGGNTAITGRNAMAPTEYGARPTPAAGSVSPNQTNRVGSSAMTGASIGSAFGPVGAAVGGFAGSLVGAAQGTHQAMGAMSPEVQAKFRHAFRNNPAMLSKFEENLAAEQAGMGGAR